MEEFLNLEDCILMEDVGLESILENYDQYYSLPQMEAKLANWRQKLKAAEGQGNRNRANILKNEIKKLEQQIHDAKMKKKSA